MENNPEAGLQNNAIDKEPDREKLPPIMEVIEEEDMEIQEPMEEEDLVKSVNKDSVAK